MRWAWAAAGAGQMNSRGQWWSSRGGAAGTYEGIEVGLAVRIAGNPIGSEL